MVPTISWLRFNLILISILLSPKILANKDNPQFALGDKLSIFSDKAFRKDGGDIFEAIGNVIIISAKDTLYGESATFNRKTMDFHIEGNVRFISEGMTLFGSEINYNTVTGYMEILDARLSQAEFNIIAHKIQRISPDEYLALRAEFSTCRDCPESWSIYGDKILVKQGSYAKVSHGLLRIRGVNVLYIPYIVLPIQTKRKTGLLFPKFSNRIGEGAALEQPIFWAINEASDATISPTFWALRGQGGDLEYRHRFGHQRWMYLNTRLINDTIYQPDNTGGQSQSGKSYFRHFVEAEHHYRWTPNLIQHIRYTGAKDLDIVRDSQQFTEQKILSSDLGFDGFVDYRKDLFSLSVEADYLRNQIYDRPDRFDNQFVQTLPRIGLSSIPVSILQTDVPMFQHMAVHLGGSFTRFRQLASDEDDEYFDDQNRPLINNIRNVDRVTVNPTLYWQMLSKGPFGLRSEIQGDYQKYYIQESQQTAFEKNATLVKTEFSFNIDRIFGLAYQEKVNYKDLTDKERKELEEIDKDKIKPLQPEIKPNKMIGKIDKFDTSITNDEVLLPKNSYRHLQEYKFIHHYIPEDNTSGNKQFFSQIQTGAGWFDYLDAIRANEYKQGGNATRTVIPPQNTIEFQWNNFLIKKTPKNYQQWMFDEKYLRDNFNYTQIGYINISQGYVFSNEDSAESFRDRLTRLYTTAGYSAEKWSVTFSDFYFHTQSSHSSQIAFQRNFETVNFLSSYRYNSFPESRLNFLSLGLQLRPIDTLGLSLLREVENGIRNIRSVYAIDIMPNNNCWILNLNYRDTLVDKRYFFNIMFNFGDDMFQTYKRDYFAVRRF